MLRPRTFLLSALLLSASVGLAACGEPVDVAQNSPYHHGAELFHQRCAGCHTLDEVHALGSATDRKSREKVDGPNFNQRKEQVNQVLYAIRNGGFSGAIMPQNVVVGSDAVAVAKFLAKYSGKDAKGPKGPPIVAQPASQPNRAASGSKSKSKAKPRRGATARHRASKSRAGSTSGSK